MSVKPNRHHDFEREYREGNLCVSGNITWLRYALGEQQRYPAIWQEKTYRELREHTKECKECKIPPWWFK